MRQPDLKKPPLRFCEKQEDLEVEIGEDLDVVVNEEEPVAGLYLDRSIKLSQSVTVEAHSSTVKLSEC